MDFIWSAINLVVPAVCLRRRRAVLIFFVPVKSCSASMRLWLVVVAQVVLIALQVVRNVNQIFGIVVERTLRPITGCQLLRDALLRVFIVHETRSAVTLYRHTGIALNKLVTSRGMRQSPEVERWTGIDGGHLGRGTLEGNGQDSTEQKD